MTPEEEEQYEVLRQRAELEQMQRISAESKVMHMSGYEAGKEPNIIEYQLDVSPALNRIYHLLSGHELVVDTQGNEVWKEPDDDRLKILSPYGVKQIMNLLSQYISPDTLLSNLKEEDIYRITKVFGEELCDLMYCRYEHFYHHPTPEELFEEYKPLIKKHKLDIKEEELYTHCVNWSREELRMKFRHFPMHVHSITHKVFINLMRALNGQERTSLRKQVNVHESLNQNPQMNYQPKREGVFSRWKK